MTPYLKLLNEVVAAHNQSVYFNKEGDGRIWVLDIKTEKEINKDGFRYGSLQIVEGSEIPSMIQMDFNYQSEDSIEIAAKEFMTMLLLEKLQSFSKEIV